MTIEIEHLTTYRYARPVALNPHRLMLVPRSSHDLRILSNTIECTPQARLEWSLDVFANVIATASFSEPTTRLVVKSKASVDQSAQSWPIFPISPEAHAFPFTYSEDERIDLCAALNSQYKDPGERLQQWAESFVRSRPTDTLSLLKDINAGIGARIAYRIRDEEGTQGPAGTLDLGSGSCRDIASLFIDVVRRLGFGARAVSGYLFDPDATGDGSTHAWAEVYLPGAGWIAFDPTRNHVGSAMLIPVGVGRCNEQILPVSGSYAGAPEDFLEMTVQVAVREADPE